MNLPFKTPSLSTENLFSPEMLNSPTIQAVIAGIFVFFLFILLGLSRRILTRTSLHGLWAGFIMGILAVGIIEGGFVYLLQGLNSESGFYVPNNLRALLNTGQKNITQVLGVQTERQVPTAQSVILDYQVLSNLDSELARGQICTTATEGKIE
ncbi:MAG: hypothetical protein A3A58_03620 [Candidatus Blackburnbacteria bacterium RIFCSPLOWO2_01_FULL_41_27]|uniref:Uncharacterized protein n=2 Tax=Candidatus Blackburniibacteriota TaxID=1817898 RepID=A0A1G1VEA5_9BACT|nr:MAG: hypothetical protein A3A58_03620 [Candidatus Blackburnbacteria bacterium RIFCSPLOWO2_01_FULL_41_27]